MKANFYKKIKRFGTWTDVMLLYLSLLTPGYAQTWSDVGGGMCDWVNASVVYNGELVVGGRFTCAGGVPANYIAKWNGTSWSALGSGLNGWVNALTVYNGNLIVGGQFSQAGSTQVNYLAKWNGNSWSDVNGDMGANVAALTVFNGDLIVGGYFTDADGFPANYIVGWNNSAGWIDLGGGMGGSQGQVMALRVYNNELIAAGFFTTAGGSPAAHIARWNGTAWSTLGSGITGITYSLGAYNGDLIAGGLFVNAGGNPASSIAKWDGSSWSALGSGMGATPVGYNYVFALEVYNGSLFAGGMFETAGGVTAHSIAKWDGSGWADLQGGVWYGGSNVYAVNALSVFNNDLYAGGIFTTAGSLGVAHMASWHESATGITDHGTASNLLQLKPSPNPVQENVQIVYQLAATGMMKLRVMDLTGRELQLLVSEVKPAGDYSLEWNAGELAPGLYFISLTSGGLQETVRVIKK